MTGEKKMFTSYVKNKDSQDMIIFGDGNQCKVKGLGKIAITNEHSISNVFLVELLGYNLLSISQLCYMGYNCLFTNVDVSVFRRNDGSLAFKGDDIIFGSTNQKSCEEFSRVMTQKFEMSMMGELTYFLGFQVKQLKDDTFISQTKYTQDILKRFGMKDAKPAKTPMGTDGHVDLNKGGMPLIMLLCAFQSTLVIYGAQVVQVIPRPHKSICE
jgi:hypothetical protein